MNNRKFWPELFGMGLYKTEGGKYFYAWGWKHAEKKKPGETLYCISVYGDEIKLRNT